MKCQYVNVCYQLGLKNLNERNAAGWTKSVKELLLRCGFGDVWYNQGVGDISHFLRCFKSRIKDIDIQEWRTRLENSTRASFYREYKLSFESSSYLNFIYVKGHRMALTRLLTSSHSLHVATQSCITKRAPLLL